MLVLTANNCSGGDASRSVCYTAACQTRLFSVSLKHKSVVLERYADKILSCTEI